MAALFSSQIYATCILLSLMAATIPGHVDAAYTMQETCSYFSEGYIGDPTNCQGWGYCSGGLLLKTGMCGSGLLYDSARGMCNWASSVTCTSTLTNVCANMVDNAYVADPNNCQGYAFCSNSKVMQTFNCPTNQVFNPLTETCVWSSSPQNNCAANSICRLVQNNKFVGDPTACGNYIRCQNGAGVRGPNGLVSQQCTTDGTMFNPIKGGCDPNYKCNVDPGVPGVPNTPNVPSTNSTVCAAYYNTNTKGVQYFSDGQTCYGYYVCKDATSKGTWGSCDFALHFNPAKSLCVTPWTYACPYDRCGNLNLSFVAKLGCQTYSICSNQRSVGSGDCAASNPDFAYFDEVGGGCVAAEPAQDICTDKSNWVFDYTTTKKP